MSEFACRGRCSTAGILSQPRGTWLAAAVMSCAAFAVLLGVLLMHSLPMVHPPGGHSAAAAPLSPTALHPSTTGDHHGNLAHSDAPAAAAAVPLVVFQMGCTTDCSTSHAGMAMCMAVITVVAALFLVRRLLMHHCGDDVGHGAVRWLGRHASRAPPWAAPSLEKLSVLRI